MNNLKLLTGIFLLLLLIGCKKKDGDNLNVKVETYGASDLTQSEARLTGVITEYGDIGVNKITYGFCWDTIGNPIVGNESALVTPWGAGQLGCIAENLIPNTQYYFRAFATNYEVTTYGKLMSFKTLALPSLRSDDAINITDSSATISGGILYDAGNAIIKAGICWAPDTLIDYWGLEITADLNDSVLVAPNGSREFSFNVKGLHAWVNYSYRAYCITNKGVTYGKTNSFRTTGDGGESTSVKDVDGNEYNTRKIKNQVFMIDKLKTKHYANNDSIPYESNILAWPDLKKGAYQYLNSEGLYGNTQNNIYNFYAVIDSRNVCPVGWHVSTYKDWEQLINYLGGPIVSGWAFFYILDLPTDLMCWAVSEDKASAGIFSHKYNLWNLKTSLEKSTDYSGLSVICVKD